MNTARVGEGVGVVERPADVAPSFVSIALMPDCNDPIAVGLNEPFLGIGCASWPAASREKASR
jgi:hypothetical protein